VFVLVLAVPALLVVVLGYVLGHGLWTLVADDAGAEPAGWLTGGVALVVAARCAVVRIRRHRRQVRTAGGRQVSRRQRRRSAKAAAFG
jgi:hypothetical protein